MSGLTEYFLCFLDKHWQVDSLGRESVLKNFDCEVLGVEMIASDRLTKNFYEDELLVVAHCLAGSFGRIFCGEGPSPEEIVFAADLKVLVVLGAGVRKRELADALQLLAWWEPPQNLFLLAKLRLPRLPG